MIKVLRRYRFVVWLFLLLAGGGVIYFWPGSARISEVVPPAPAIIGQALATQQGITIQWLPTQAGTYSVSGYLIEKSRQGSQFTRLAHVEKGARTYIDADGRIGDRYRIIAEDDQRPANRSAPSEVTRAVASKPGDKVLLAQGPHVPSVLGAASALTQAATPREQAALLQNLLAEGINAYDAAVTAKHITVVGSILTAIQEYQQQLLTLFPQLSAPQKAASAEVCTRSQSLLAPNASLLPEADHMDSLLVQAGCQALAEAAR